MKSLITLPSAAALLASGISAAPLNERGTIEAKVTRDYDIDTAIVELEDEFKDAFGIDGTTSIREKTEVFLTSKRADFVLPKTESAKGMIIELKCENKNDQKGGAIKTPVNKDKDKRFDVKPAYADYTFVVLVMAYSTEAEKASTGIGMHAIPNAKLVLSGSKGTMKAFKEILKHATAEMEDLTNRLAGLNTNSRPASPSPKPAAPAPKKPAASAPKPAGSGSGSGKGKKPAQSNLELGKGKKPAGSGSETGKGKKPAGSG